MKLIFAIKSEADSNGVKEYAVIIRGMFPITKYRQICEIEDGLLNLVNKEARKRVKHSK